ncbi:hypothetical protein COU04_00920 [bacterium (Candidatus Gribaldobacteria) CG10_big_fil_rev_8_21_14_0_10_33_41]|nr:MAG: hypothetical protein COU04_00920 [bacterium (Candidatus Gribaldobacteria) CG10_big_fil_rev_8_21_14_0_10_33_41]
MPGILSNIFSFPFSISFFISSIGPKPEISKALFGPTPGISLINLKNSSSSKLKNPNNLKLLSPISK